MDIDVWTKTKNKNEVRPVFVRDSILYNWQYIQGDWNARNHNICINICILLKSVELTGVWNYVTRRWNRPYLRLCGVDEHGKFVWRSTDDLSYAGHMICAGPYNSFEDAQVKVEIK